MRQYLRTPLWFLLLLISLVVLITLPALGTALDPETTEQSEDTAAVQLAVEITGIEGQLLENAQAFMQIMQLADALKDGSKTMPSETRLRWLHRQAEEDITEALHPFGYYKPEISGELTQTEMGWRAEYKVKPGPVLKIADINVRVTGAGANDPGFKKILNNLPLKQGNALKHPAYEQIKTQLQAVATERGYFDARLTVSQILIDLEAYKADIKLELVSGERYRYGTIKLEQDTLRPEVLEHYVEIEPGEPYFAPDLLELQSDLINSQYFEQVLIDADPGKADGTQIPITVQLEMRKRSKYTFGLGYGTDTGARVRADAEYRWVNSRGHKMDIRLLGSQIKSSLDVSYAIPAENPQFNALKLTGQIAMEDSDVKNSSTGRLRLSRDLQLGEWTGNYGVEYLLEEFEISGDTQTTQLLGLSLNMGLVEAKNRMRVEDGYSINTEFYIASDAIISDISLLQAAVKTKFIKSLNEKSRLIARAQAGTTWITDEDFTLLPTSLRFFAGGDNSIRGYALDVVGPRNEENDVIGGRHLLVGSLEYEYRLYDQWSVAAFADTGDAFDNDTPQFKTGVGIGVRWQSPVGPIRVDLAHGLEEPGDTIRLHLNIGPDL